MANILDIIIPMYNTPKEYITRALNSINKQKGIDFKSIGVIIIDDCSTKIKYKKSWFKQSFPKLQITYIINKENVGPGVSRQNGIDISEAKYITFLDSDDEFIGFDSINNILSCLEEYNLSKLSTAVNEEVFNGKETINLKHDNTSLQSLHALYLNREFLLKYNIRFDNKLRRYEDLFYICLVNSFSGENQAFVDEITYNWKWNSNSLMRDSKQIYPDLDDQIYAFTKAHEILDKNNIDYKKSFISDMTLLYLIINSNILDLEEYKNNKEKYINEFKKEYLLHKEWFESVDKEILNNCINKNLNSLLNSYPWLNIRSSFEDFIEKIGD